MRARQRRSELVSGNLAGGDNSMSTGSRPLVGYLIQHFGRMALALWKERSASGRPIGRLSRDSLLFVSAAFTVGLVLGSRLAGRRTIRRP